MKRIKTWFLVLGLSAPVVLNVGCTSAVSRQMWEAVLAGAAAFVQDTTFNLLSQNVVVP